jgi:hypothetical protein
MFTITIRRQKRPGERWQPVGEATVAPASPARLPEAEASESDVLRVQVIAPPDAAPAVRVRVGSVLVASTIPADRVALLDHDDADGADAPPLVCRGRFLADWVGLTELTVEVRLGDDPRWTQVLELPLAVTAGKLATEEFHRLFAELEHDAAAVLLDVHGKTQVGMRRAGSLASSAPVAMLSRISATVAELTDLLRRMARRPASRLRVRRSRELALPGQAISDATLAEACRDPGLLGQVGAAVAFREHLREHSRPDYRTPEHRAIADFAEYLKAQLADLRQRIDAEVLEREGRRRWRNFAPEPGKPTWWEAEDLPRIEELRRCRARVAELRAAVDEWGRLPFLPPGRCLRTGPPSTPVFRNVAVYRGVYRVIASHFQAYQATLDTQAMLTRARSLPVLYEWWCAVRVVRVLARGLTPLGGDDQTAPLISTGLAQEGRRFTIEFASDQAITFTDGRRTRVRFRYQPRYAAGEVAGQAVAVLEAGALRTPDMALEIYQATAEGRACPHCGKILEVAPAPAPDIPALIVVLDAKYSSLPQWEKMKEVAASYSKLGDPRTGRVLSRQVWALTPAAPAGGPGADGLRRYCTVDNEAFWSEQFDLDGPVNGAVQTRPVEPGSFDPLAALLVRLLKRAGVGYAADAGAQGG